MVLPPYAALDALHRGAGCPALLGTLAEYAVFSELLATRGHMPESISVIQHAQTALCEFSQRGPATLWALPEAAYDALTAWLECYVTQAEHAGMTGILLAHAALPEFVERRPMVMKVAA
jgi:hypothetical protein